jgi:hypothetical protein
MPVQELQNQAGLGSVLGMVGGYLAANPARKAKQAQQEIENKETAARDQDYHNEVTSQIAARTAQTKLEGDDAANTQLQNGAYAQASNLLASPPKGQDPQAWAQSAWRRATSPIASGGLGLTDPKLQGDLYAQVQDAVGKAVQAKADQFTGHEQALPTDPKARLTVLLKRLQVERGIPGVDTKVTQQMIADTQKQILDQENRLHQSVMDYFAQQRLNQGNQRIQISLENAATRRAGGGYNSGLSDSEEDIENQAMRSPDLKTALRILQRANLPVRDARRIREDLEDNYKYTKDPNAPDYRSEATALSGPDWNALPLVTRSTVRGLVTKHGIQDTVSALTAIANGAKSPKMTREQAQAALDALNGGQ